MLGEERMITGPEAGITRDSITLDWEWQGRPVQLVDTAGLRKRAKIEDKLEKLSAADTPAPSIMPKSSCCCSTRRVGWKRRTCASPTSSSKRAGRSLIALNKWDVAEHASSLFNGVKAALEEGLSQLKNVPVLAISAKTGKAVDDVLKVAFELRESWSRRISTGELNRWFEDAVDANPPPAPSGRRIKLRYITQVKTRPADASSCSARASINCPTAIVAICSIRCGAT